MDVGMMLGARTEIVVRNGLEDRVRRGIEYSELKTEATESLARWSLAGLLAGVAFMGSLCVVVGIALFVALPAWAEVVIALVLVAGNVLFALVLAGALRRFDVFRRTQARRRAHRSSDQRSTSGKLAGTWS